MPSEPEVAVGKVSEALDDVSSEAYARFVRERHDHVMGRVRAACERAGRDMGEVLVEAVSKTVDAPAVVAAAAAGYEAFGENRPQELVRKLEYLSALDGFELPRFDMIGNLQTNKVNQVLGRATLIHSISSTHLAEAVSKRAERAGSPADVLIECNVSGEATKSGFSPAELGEALDGLMALGGLRIQGVMTMAPAHDLDAARRTFSDLRELAETLRARTGLALGTISCGMSDDFETAIEEGSTLVRLGRVAFSPAYRL